MLSSSLASFELLYGTSLLWNLDAGEEREVLLGSAMRHGLARSLHRRVGPSQDCKGPSSSYVVPAPPIKSFLGQPGLTSEAKVKKGKCRPRKTTKKKARIGERFGARQAVKKSTRWSTIWRTTNRE